VDLVIVVLAVTVTVSALQPDIASNNRTEIILKAKPIFLIFTSIYIFMLATRRLFKKIYRNKIKTV
jgi:hypothetical protein